jgi:elongation factor P
MATTSDIRKGLCIRYNNDIYKIIDFLHVKPGKGPAFVRTKLKSVTNGKVLENTFSAGHKIEDIRVETHKYQFLYNDNDEYHFMNVDDYNQISLNKTIIDNAELMKEGEMVSISINTEDNTPLSAEMPASVILEIKHTEPGLKGNTATNATKPATLETGAIVNVPLFINEGDKIKVDTEKGNYIERIKIN